MRVLTTARRPHREQDTNWPMNMTIANGVMASLWIDPLVLCVGGFFGSSWIVSATPTIAGLANSLER